MRATRRAQDEVGSEAARDPCVYIGRVIATAKGSGDPILFVAMSHTLESIAPGVYAWLADTPRHGQPNSGVVVAADGLTVIDTLTTPAQAAPLAESLAALTELPVRRVVFTSSHLESAGGSTVFPLAAIYGTGQTSDHLDQEPNPDVWRRLHPEHAAGFSDLQTRPVTHTVTEPAHLCPASIAIPVSGQQLENLVVQVPSTNLVFAGAVAAFGVTPLGFDADFPAWIATLEAIKTWGELIVPGLGTVGGHEDVSVLQEYLQACVDASGIVGNLKSGPWTAWPDSRFHEVNIERASRFAAGDPSPPDSYRRILGLL